MVLVVGAGCSAEPPTSLPLSRECALEAHRLLRADGVLDENDCSDPTDLSCVADAVVSKTTSQHALVIRLPCQEFRQAHPNEGYLLAAAMLYERALNCVMTLNFDLAMTSALVQVGAQGSVAIISKPEDHSSLGLSNLIYLHRNVEADPEQWILRSTALEEGWRDGWEEVIAQRVVSAPVTVFAGLGTPAGVLIDSTARIRKALRGNVMVYQVDPGDKESSLFFARLNLPDDAYLQMSWGGFTRELSNRLVEEHRAELEAACDDLITTQGWDSGTADAASLCERLAQLGLLKLGQLRARWVLNSSSYLPRRDVVASWLADLLLAIGLMERGTGSQAILREDGVVEFRRNNLILGAVIVAHGQGIWRWIALEAKVKQSKQYREHRTPRSFCAIVAGVVGVSGDQPPQIAAPADITWDEEPTSLISGDKEFRMYSVDQLRERPELIKEMIA